MNSVAIAQLHPDLRGRAIVAAPADFWLIALLVLLVDQASKEWARDWLAIHGPSVTLIPGAISLIYAENSGLAFGFFSGHGAVAGLVAAAAACLIAPWRELMRLAQAPPLACAFGLACLLGGALGNLLDRLIFGQVVDFIELPGGLVLNLADVAVTFGIAALVAGIARKGFRVPSSEFRVPGSASSIQYPASSSGPNLELGTRNRLAAHR